MTYMMECPFCGLVQAVPRSCDPLVPWEYARNCVNCRKWIVGGKRNDLPEPDEVIYEGRRPGIPDGRPALTYSASEDRLRAEGWPIITRLELADGAIIRRREVAQ